MERIKQLNLSNLWQSLYNRLPSQRTYIFPTKLGFYFAFLTIVLLGVAFLYNNNPAYFSCFMLISLGIITMFQTNFNMERIYLSILTPHEIQAEHPAMLHFLIENKSTQPVYHLSFQLRQHSQKVDIAYIAPKTKIEIQLTTTFKKRGYHLPPTLMAETTFPFGFLRSWKLLKPQNQILVFPNKKGSLTLPLEGTDGLNQLDAKQRAPERGQEFLGHRPYQTNDSIRQIDWKAYARTKKLNVKLYDNDDKGTQLIAWSQTSNINDLEERISQLAQWVGVCQRQKQNFVLQLPQWQSSPDNSTKHIDDCLTRLALYSIGSEP